MIRVLLFPTYVGMTLPQAKWHSDADTILHMRGSDSGDEPLRFFCDSHLGANSACGDCSVDLSASLFPTYVGMTHGDSVTAFPHVCGDGSPALSVIAPHSYFSRAWGDSANVLIGTKLYNYSPNAWE